MWFENREIEKVITSSQITAEKYVEKKLILVDFFYVKNCCMGKTEIEGNYDIIITIVNE